ncbi:MULTISPECIES: sugar phosphate isomerase/epimerase family protein [unclassified Plantibacter]|uniref:sugar phosphate isomerase/epimerase family protein n=1 Tax=unclassified Plantibacter TaxID=2624265 RepID=UPI003D32ECB6
MSTSQLSVQLYSVRDALAADTAGTLQRLAEIGFRQAEPFGFGPDADLTAVHGAGFTTPSAHANFIKEGTDLAAYFGAAAAAGVKVLIDPAIAAERFSSADGVKGIADDLNAAAAVGAQHGVEMGYHNHWWELEGDIEGTSPLEYLASITDPAVVFEVDTYWVEVGGRRAVDVLASIGDRVKLLHVKDGDASRDTKKQLPSGAGVIPVLDILAAAPNALRVVEFDDYDGDIFAGLQQSYDYLTANGVTA